MEEKLPAQAGNPAVTGPDAATPVPLPGPDPAIPPGQMPVVQQPVPQAKALSSKDLLKSADFYLVIGVLAAAILVGAMVLHFMDRWRRRQDSSDCEAPLTLSAFREMYENGEITQSEYEKILQKMAKKIKADVGIKNVTVQLNPPAANNGAPTKPLTDGTDTTPPV